VVHPGEDQGTLESFFALGSPVRVSKQQEKNIVKLDVWVATQQFQDHQLIGRAYLLGLQIAQAFSLPNHDSMELINKVNDALQKFIKIVQHTTRGGVSTRYILREAFDRNLPFFYRTGGYYQIGMGKKQRVFFRSATLHDSALGAGLTQDKYLCIQHLKSAGIPTPDSRRVKDPNQAKMAASSLGFPVVLKPSNLDRGEGVFIDLKTDKEIEVAFKEIEKISKNISIENRVPGICHRLLVFRDEVFFAFARHPRSIVGDGETEIGKLIENEIETQKKKVVYLQKQIQKV
jgi:hypothetical protein